MNRFHAQRLGLALAVVLLAACTATPVADMPAPAATAGVPSSAPAQVPVTDTACTGPRTKMCSTISAPVCATRDTGIRCITTPCPSSERKTFSSACAACRDPQVSGWTEGACPGG